MLFSIVVPIYKVEKYLRECVDSILCQSFSDFEIILVDDGSPDGCPRICDEYAEKDPRVKVIHKTNGGLSDARNTGLDAATGDYVIFLDSDDYWDDKDALSKTREVLFETSADVVTWRFKKYSEDTKTLIQVGSDIAEQDKDNFEVLLKSKNLTVSACTKCIRRSMFEEHDLRFVKGVLSEDIEWCARLLCAAETIVPSNLDFYIYRQRSASITHEIGGKNVQDLKSHLLAMDKMKQEMLDDRGEKLKRLLAEEFCNFVVTLTAYKNWQQEVRWVKEKKSWLKWACTRRSKILRYMLNIVGVKASIKLIKLVR